MTVVKEHVRISCHICSLQLPRRVAVDTLAGFLTCTQSGGVGCLQLSCVLASEPALPALGRAARQRGLSSTQPLCRGGTHRVFLGCSSFRGKLRCWLFPPCLCVPSSLRVLTQNLRIRRGSSCKTCIQPVSKLSPVSDTHPKGSMGSWA